MTNFLPRSCQENSSGGIATAVAMYTSHRTGRECEKTVSEQDHSEQSERSFVADSAAVTRFTPTSRHVYPGRLGSGFASRGRVCRNSRSSHRLGSHFRRHQTGGCSCRLLEAVVAGSALRVSRSSLSQQDSTGPLQEVAPASSTIGSATVPRCWLVFLGPPGPVLDLPGIGSATHRRALCRRRPD